ncbi:MAG: DoxX family protein [Bacteriovoracaceae bacterium]
MLRSYFHEKILALCLTIPFIYHGLWNLSEPGGVWWALNFQSAVPLRFVVGGLEILAALALFFDYYKKIAALFIALTMVGAIGIHWKSGYSFKENGIETPLTYFLLCLTYLIGKNENKTITRD